MSRIFVIEKNENGKIELTKEELQQMLDDAYHQGYSDGKESNATITYPSHPWTVTYCDQNTTPLDKYKVTISGSSECCERL